MSRYYTITIEDGEPYVTGFDALALAMADAAATGGQVLDAVECAAWLAALPDDLSGHADDGMAAWLADDNNDYLCRPIGLTDYEIAPSRYAMAWD